MQVPPNIVFRNLPRSEFIEKAVIAHINSLQDVSLDIIRCRVVVERPHHRHHQGDLYHIQVELTLPRKELVVKRGPALHHAHEDVYVAIRDAFDAMRRQLQDYMRLRRGDVKHHEEMPAGKISKILADRRYGFITTDDGQDVYFHEHSLVDGQFDTLEVGMPVRCAVEEGEKGLQASTVYVS